MKKDLIRFEVKPKRRFAKEDKHNSYGIYHWFKLHGLHNQKIITDIVNDFCEANKPIGTDRVSYVSANFSRFAKYVKDNGKLNPVNKNNHSNER